MIYKAIGKSKHLYDRKIISLIEKTKDGFVIRYFSVCKTLTNTKMLPDVSLHESFRIFIITDKNEIKICSYTIDRIVDNKSKWRKSTKREIPESAYVYHRNLKKAFKDTIYGIESLAEMFKRAGEIRPEKYIYSFIKNPNVEFFLKLGLYKIVEENSSGEKLNYFINTEGKSLRQILGINKEHLIMLREMNAESTHLKIMQMLVKENIKFTSKEILNICDQISESYWERMIYIFKYCSIYQALKYLEDQHGHKKEKYISSYYKYYDKKLDYIVSDWYDYITQCIALNYDLKKEFVIFPKNLNKRHSQLSALMETKKSKVLDNAILRRHNLIASGYFYKNDNLMIVIPKSAKELYDEGTALKHCVGGYSERMAKGFSDILFIRNVSEPKKSYYTVEIKGMKILQCRGMENCNMNSEVSSFIDEWMKHLGKNEKEKISSIPYAPSSSRI